MLCCTKSPIPRPEFFSICIGLDNAGKTTILSLVSNEETTDIQPTSGFIIKPIQLKEIILNVREIGGGEKIRPFWKHYFNDCQAIIFVVNSAASDADMNTAREALKDSLQNVMLSGLPCLVLGNCQDVSGARQTEQLKEVLDLEHLCEGRQWCLYLCSRQLPDSAREGLEWLSHQLLPPTPDDVDTHHIEFTAQNSI